MTFRISLFITTFLVATTTLSQSIYLDRIPAYHSLSCCAQLPISTIIRGMVNGCGDDNALTSYACFCSSSSGYFSSMISSKALNGCGRNAKSASKAVDVFNSYCAIGATGTQATLAKTTTTSVCKPAATGSSNQPPATRTTANTPPPASTPTSGMSRTLELMIDIKGMLILGIAVAFLSS